MSSVPPWWYLTRLRLSEMLHKQLMQQTSRLEQSVMADRPTIAWPPNERSLNLALVYQDARTRQWSGRVRELMANVIGEEALHCTEWSIDDLRKEAPFREGVLALAQADAIVVAVYEAEHLPAQFYLWVNLWLQQRCQAGALVGLIGTSGAPTLASLETRRYLHAIAS